MTEKRRDIATRIIYDLKDNLAWFPRYQSYLRNHRPPTLILWGPQDGYMPEASARAYLRDLPEAELHLLDVGHWLLETNLAEAVDLTRGFLQRVHRRILSRADGRDEQTGHAPIGPVNAFAYPTAREWVFCSCR